ncbi:MAG: ferrous iron transport protein A [Candidatus Omnitrophica bacterium]|nr:ferrous iron transport protein A [Candidatus Omnitrophota bacterium]
MKGSDKELVVLSSMSLGQKGRVVAFSFDTEEGERVHEIGLSLGEQFEVVRLHPQGETIEIKIRGYFVSIGKQEAGHIKVKPLF